MAMVAGCAPAALPDPPMTGPVPPAQAGVDSAAGPVGETDGPAALARAQASFAFELYRAVAQVAPDDGLVLSPTNLHTALLLARAGARGSTADEMDRVLHLAGLTDAEGLGAGLDRTLRSRGNADGVELDTANRAWVDDRLGLLEGYRQALAGFDAGVAGLDIAGDPEAARAAVNRWAADATRGKIEELMPSGSVTRDTRLLLATAVYLHARWARPFDAGRTAPAPFRLLDGDPVDVETMQLTARLDHGRGDGWAAVRLPYAGDALSMTVVVPDDLPTFERDLDLRRLAEVDAALDGGRVRVALPRFAVRSHLSLPDQLAALGMPTAFDERRADFSGMTDREQLFLAAVEHEAVVEVDEQGTEAAAATGIAVAGTSMQAPPPEVVVDRPFLFVLRDDATGAVLFLGRVTDPR